MLCISFAQCIFALYNALYAPALHGACFASCASFLHNALAPLHHRCIVQVQRLYVHRRCKEDVKQSTARKDARKRNVIRDV